MLRKRFNLHLELAPPNFLSPRSAPFLYCNLFLRNSFCLFDLESVYGSVEHSVPALKARSSNSAIVIQRNNIFANCTLKKRQEYTKKGREMPILKGMN